MLGATLLLVGIFSAANLLCRLAVYFGRVLYNTFPNLDNPAGALLPTPAAPAATPVADLRRVLSITVTTTTTNGRYTTSTRRTCTVRLHHEADQQLSAGGTKFALSA